MTTTFCYVTVIVNAQMCYYQHRYTTDSLSQGISVRCRRFQLLHEQLQQRLKILEWDTHKSHLVFHRWHTWDFWNGKTFIFLGTLRSVSILEVAHLTAYCDWYVYKTFLSFPSLFLFLPKQFILDPALLYENCFFICTIPFPTVWPLN